MCRTALQPTCNLQVVLYERKMKSCCSAPLFRETDIFGHNLMSLIVFSETLSVSIFVSLLRIIVAFQQ